MMQDQQGFTLMETLFAMALFAIGMSALFPAFLNHIRYNNFSEVRSASYAAAQTVLDDLRLQDPADLPSTGSDDPETVMIGNRAFSVVISYCEDAGFCTSNDTRQVTTRVSYNGELIYDVDTVYTSLR